MTIFGHDSSHYDWSRGPMDLAAAVRAGISFATHKATEGATYRDPRFSEFCARAHGVIPVPGAYHVLHSGNINAQVDWFLRALRSAAPWWQDGPFIIQLDCERWPQDFPGAADIEAWCDRFHLLTKSTHRVVVYASRGQYGNRIKGDCPLWNANYPSGRAAAFGKLYPGDRGVGWGPYSGREAAAIWQYASTATIGAQQECDVNAFRGTLNDLKTLVWPKGGDMVDTTTQQKIDGAWFQSTQVPSIDGAGLVVNRSAHVQLIAHVRALEAAIVAVQAAVAAGTPLTAAELATLIAEAKAAAVAVVDGEVAAALEAGAQAAGHHVG